MKTPFTDGIVSHPYRCHRIRQKTEQVTFIDRNVSPIADTVPESILK